MSFSARGYHDHPTGYHEQQMEYAHFDTRLTTIEENQQEIRNTLLPTFPVARRSRTMPRRHPAKIVTVE